MTAVFDNFDPEFEPTMCRMGFRHSTDIGFGVEGKICQGNGYCDYTSV
jgi:hypothetical protein